MGLVSLIPHILSFKKTMALFFESDFGGGVSWECVVNMKMEGKYSECHQKKNAE